MSLYILLVAHIVISVLSAAIASTILKKKYTDNRVKIFIFFFSISFAIVIFGSLLSLWLSFYLTRQKSAQIAYKIEKINLEELYNQFPVVNRLFGESFLTKLTSQDNSNLKNKMKALVYMANNISKENILIFKNLLHDSDNEIRLYSFATLSNLEKSINNNINSTLRDFKTNSGSKRAKLADKLALLYWDLFYFELIDEEMISFILGEVTSYARIAHDELSCRVEMSILIAKVSLYQKDYTSARLMFLRAIKFGADKNNLLAYLAQIEYELKNFQEVKNILCDVDQFAASSLVVQVARQWDGR